MLKQAYNTTHQAAVDEPGFQPINRGYNSVFRPRQLSLGLVVPLETYSQGPMPTMTRHLERVQLAEQLGFSAVWLRDVPFNVPSFGDAGQMYDPFVYLGLLAGQTYRIALGVASIVLPLRHPAHVAKAAASVDVLSGGRLILGVASGDRPDEYPALNLPFAERGARFRDSFDYIERMWKDAPAFDKFLWQPTRRDGYVAQTDDRQTADADHRRQPAGFGLDCTPRGWMDNLSARNCCAGTHHQRLANARRGSWRTVKTCSSVALRRSDPRSSSTTTTDPPGFPIRCESSSRVFEIIGGDRC